MTSSITAKLASALLLAMAVGVYPAVTRAADAPPATTQSSQTVDVPATIEAFEQADLYAKTAGYVTDVKADIGDHVKAGQVLSVIDNPELASELGAAQAGRRAKEQLVVAAKAAVEQA